MVCQNQNAGNAGVFFETARRYTQSETGNGVASGKIVRLCEDVSRIFDPDRALGDTSILVRR